MAAQQRLHPTYTRVTLDFAPLPDGACELTLTHDGVPPQYAEQTPKGWERMLEGLETVLGA